MSLSWVLPIIAYPTMLLITDLPFICRKNEDIIVLLLENGANPLCLDEKLHTYVHLAAYHNLPRAIKALVAHGIDINAQVLWVLYAYSDLIGGVALWV